MPRLRILVVEDDSTLRIALYRYLDRQGHHVITANSVAEGLNLGLTEKAIDLALIDLRLPDASGIDLMLELKAYHPQIKVIILTGSGTIEEAVKATQKGAFHFLTKPFNLNDLSNYIDKACEKTIPPPRELPVHSLCKKYEFDNIIGQSESLKKVLEMVERVADSDSTVFIMGESGTGKELIARAIHSNSHRSEKAFVPVNCCAIPRDLLESELFGHIKGAFTGALNNRIGRFELAHQGTLFLDEIGDMEPNLQVKLLRVLQERKFEPVGGTKSIDCDVRIIAATNVDIEKAVLEGKFREDLFYRLNVIPIRVPPLRERVTDIPILLNYYLNYFNKSKKKQLTRFSELVLETLTKYSWPGNIRELENLVERLAILKGSGEIQMTDLPEKFLSQSKSFQLQPQNQAEIPDLGFDFNTAVDAYENALISSALKKTNWNRNRAAHLLGLNRTTLVEKIKKKGLKPPENEM